MRPRAVPDAATSIFCDANAGGPVDAEVLACFEAEGPFRPSELPGSLDEAGRLVLVRRLVLEGFLRVI